MVLSTVRSLGSSLMTFSYSAMAFCSLPCWTNFSAELSTFVLLKPNPSAIKLVNRGLVLPFRKNAAGHPSSARPAQEGKQQFRLKYHTKTAKPKQQGRFPLYRQWFTLLAGAVSDIGRDCGI